AEAESAHGAQSGDRRSDQDSRQDRREGADRQAAQRRGAAPQVARPARHAARRLDSRRDPIAPHPTLTFAESGDLESDVAAAAATLPLVGHCRLSTTRLLDYRLPTTDSRLPTTDSRLPTTDYRLPTTDY